MQTNNNIICKFSNFFCLWKTASFTDRSKPRRDTRKADKFTVYEDLLSFPRHNLYPLKRNPFFFKKSIAFDIQTTLKGNWFPRLWPLRFMFKSFSTNEYLTADLPQWQLLFKRPKNFCKLFIKKCQLSSGEGEMEGHGLDIKLNDPKIWSQNTLMRDILVMFPSDLRLYNSSQCLSHLSFSFTCGIKLCRAYC